jgi:hypothetical protein
MYVLRNHVLNRTTAQVISLPVRAASIVRALSALIVIPDTAECRTHDFEFTAHLVSNSSKKSGEKK